MRRSVGDLGGASTAMGVVLGGVLVVVRLPSPVSSGAFLDVGDAAGDSVVLPRRGLSGLEGLRLGSGPPARRTGLRASLRLGLEVRVRVRSFLAGLLLGLSLSFLRLGLRASLRLGLSVTSFLMGLSARSLVLPGLGAGTLLLGLDVLVLGLRQVSRRLTRTGGSLTVTTALTGVPPCSDPDELRLSRDLILDSTKPTALAALVGERGPPAPETRPPATPLVLPTTLTPAAL